LAAALGATYTPTPAPLAGEATWTDDMEFTVPSKGRVDVTFFLWSRLVDEYRQRLAYDAEVGATRASLNKELKLALTDSCLVDAIIYSGRNGDGIRVAMRKAVCRTLGGTTGATGPCDLSGAPAPRRIAFVTESIGSKILFDALRDLWASSAPCWPIAHICRTLSSSGSSPMATTAADCRRRRRPKPTAHARRGSCERRVPPFLLSPRRVPVGRPPSRRSAGNAPVGDERRS
jgi:hypothetical protein